MITFAITVKDEEFELKRLVLSLLPHIRRDMGEQIIILADNRIPLPLLDWATFHADKVKTVEFKDDFACFKNELLGMSRNKWIFQIDADEMVPFVLIDRLRKCAVDSSCPEVLYVPRINWLVGLTQDDIDKYGFKINERGWDGFPDFQARFFLNNGKIKWENTAGGAHEILTGWKDYAAIEAKEENALLHIKDIARQRRQNEYYKTIERANS
jgi:hypothetical protein